MNEKALDKWLDAYEKKSNGFSVCELVGSYGDGTVDDMVGDVLRIHDDYVLREGELA